MDPYARALLIGHDVVSVIKQSAQNYDGDLSKKLSDFFLNSGAFATVLIEIQEKLNSDTQLNLLEKLNLHGLKPDPGTGQTFADYYYNKNTIQLVRALDGMLNHSPYV